MQRHFDVQLNKLKEYLLKMRALVEKMIDLSIKGFIECDREISKEVSTYETDVNDLQIEIDERVLRLLALMQPVATDLRFIVMVSKISGELERIADLAMNVCQNTQFIALQQKDSKILSDLIKMGNVSKEMLKESLDSFVNRDAELAKKVLESDDQLDVLKENIFEQLIEKIISDVSNVNTYIPLMLISRNLERIGDQTTNIAEEVIYLVLGKDVRHHHEEKKREENGKKQL